MSGVAGELEQRIRREGPIPFAVFMEAALYGPGGYYNRDSVAIGELGDFVTGSSLSPLFGRATARLLDRLDAELGSSAVFLEAGYGNGVHLGSVADANGGGRRLLGWDRVERPLPEGVAHLEAPEALTGGFSGLLFSYELFDALPVHRLIGRRNGDLGELRVGLDGSGEFVWQEGDVSDPALRELLGGQTLDEGQVADLSPGWEPLYRRLANTLDRGLMVTCDYGFERPVLLDRRVRRHGTLACYREHRVHRDALRDPGAQDLTAHVDFTSLREAGEESGLNTVVFTRQARWLTALDLFDDIGHDPDVRRQASALLDGGGMGEEIRVLVQAKGVEPSRLFDLELLGA